MEFRNGTIPRVKILLQAIHARSNDRSNDMTLLAASIDGHRSERPLRKGGEGFVKKRRKIVKENS